MFTFIGRDKRKTVKVIHGAQAGKGLIWDRGRGNKETRVCIDKKIDNRGHRKTRSACDIRGRVGKGDKKQVGLELFTFV